MRGQRHAPAASLSNNTSEILVFILFKASCKIGTFTPIKKISVCVFVCEILKEKVKTSVLVEVKSSI